jgi:hypothetical protein
MSAHHTPAEWLTHLANWIDSYWQDGMRPDEWTLKEWANTCRWYAPSAAEAELALCGNDAEKVAEKKTPSA